MERREEDQKEPTAAPKSRIGTRHIKKRTLRNKGLAISFSDEDLRDFVTGFHRRKKKRRKQAQQQLQEKERHKCIEERKKRKIEREFALYGGPVPVENPYGAGLGADESNTQYEDNGTSGQTASVYGTKMYDNGDMTITVTTSELTCEDEDLKVQHYMHQLKDAVEKKHSIHELKDAVEKKPSLALKKKPLEKATKHQVYKKPKTYSRKGKKKGQNRR